MATFAGCKITGKAGSYTLTATPPAGLGHQHAFNISVGAATQLAFTTQPDGGANGAAWTTQPVVTVEDSGGNTVTTATNPVTLAIATQPGSGATLACTTNPVNASQRRGHLRRLQDHRQGRQLHPECHHDRSDLGHHHAFTITVGTATQLVFTTQPGDGADGADLATQPVVTVEDARGNTVISSTASVTLAIATQPAAGHLTCTNDPVNGGGHGVATFTGCEITGTAGSYT